MSEKPTSHLSSLGHIQEKMDMRSSPSSKSVTVINKLLGEGIIQQLIPSKTRPVDSIPTAMWFIIISQLFPCLGFDTITSNDNIRPKLFACRQLYSGTLLILEIPFYLCTTTNLNSEHIPRIMEHRQLQLASMSTHGRRVRLSLRRRL